MRALPLLTLVCSFLAAAPAGAQLSPPPLREEVGAIIAYRVGIPERWELKKEAGELTATDGSIALFVAAEDLVANKKELDLPVPPAEQRRIVTSMFMGSETLMLAMMDSVAEGVSEEAGHCSRVKREMRELGGQSAGFVSLECVQDDGDLGRLDAWITIKDGVMYTLMWFAPAKAYAANAPLFERVRASVVLASAPPAPE